MFSIFNNIINVYKNNISLLIISIIFLIIIILGIKFYNKFRGFMGEYHLKKELSKLNHKEYLILNDIMIEQNNTTYQIDHIVISKYGIFVIEMKNYYGHIYGSEYKKYWYQYVNGHKRMFYNPIYQNYGHVKALSNVLHMEEKYFIPIVCFSNQVKLKIKTNNKVTMLDFINKLIRTYKEIIISYDDINKIKQNILSVNITENKKRKEHVRRIKEKQK